MLLKVEEKDNTFHIYGCSKLSESICPKTMEKTSQVYQKRERIIRDLPILGKAVYIHLTTRQFKTSSGYFWEQFSFSRKRGRFTYRYEEYIFESCKGADISYVAKQQGLNHDTVSGIFHAYSKKKLKDRKAILSVTRLGIDEIALKKGHKEYVCVLVDLDTHEVVELLPQRDKAYLIGYFKGLGASFCSQVKIFCSDMWQGYLSLAEEVFPQATIIIDRFHLMNYLQKGVENARRSLRNKFKEADELKGIRWTLLKKAEHLKRDEKEHLESIFKQPKYKLLKETYEAKEELRHIFDHIPFQKAGEILEEWVKKVKEKKLRHLFSFSKKIQNYWKKIIPYFQHRLTTSPVEGINNKIKAIKRRAFGYLNFDNFRRRVLIEFLE
ncbi:MAG: ISL3 family transposase [Epibacterium sp.]|nr:ISL3 family transposase [Epibacterium sp.]NQX76035.1 ISL3 family transposase [Epibacterium sp.]